VFDLGHRFFVRLSSGFSALPPLAFMAAIIVSPVSDVAFSPDAALTAFPFEVSAEVSAGWTLAASRHVRLAVTVGARAGLPLFTDSTLRWVVPEGAAFTFGLGVAFF
jgi:hypothetical protein